MNREEQICKQSVIYTKETHSPSSISDCQAAMNIAAVKAFTAGAQWADKTMLQEVLKWLGENFYNKIDMYHDYSFDIIGLNSDFISKEQMLQSFKERFNIE